MKIIVLGATGQIGSTIFHGLRDRHNVVGTSRNPSPKYHVFDPFHDDWSLLGTADVLVNCVGQIMPTKTSTFYHVHVDLVRLIIKNRALIGNPRIVQISALGASTNHKVDFLKTKGIADDLLLEQPNTIIVRPSIVCTHHTMIVRKMLMLLNISKYTGGLIFAPQKFLQTRIQPVMPHDLVDVVHALCLNNAPQNIVNVVGPEQFNFYEMIRMIFEANRMTLRIVKLPKNISDLLIGCGVSTMLPKVISSQQYQLLFYDNIHDLKDVQRILGRSPFSPKQFFYNEFNDATH